MRPHPTPRPRLAVRHSAALNALRWMWSWRRYAVATDVPRCGGPRRRRRAAGPPARSGPRARRDRSRGARHARSGTRHASHASIREYTRVYLGRERPHTRAFARTRRGSHIRRRRRAFPLAHAGPGPAPARPRSAVSRPVLHPYRCTFRIFYDALGRPGPRRGCSAGRPRPAGASGRDSPADAEGPGRPTWRSERAGGGIGTLLACGRRPGATRTAHPRGALVPVTDSRQNGYGGPKWTRRIERCFRWYFGRHCWSRGCCCR